MGTPVSGKNGTMKIASTPIALVLEWEGTFEVVTTRAGTNESAGFKKTTPGQKSASGTAVVQYDSAAVGDLVEGGSYALDLFLDATKFYDMSSVVIKSVSPRVDIREGSIIEKRIAWESDGVWVGPL